jgi:hypothetical protein
LSPFVLLSSDEKLETSAKVLIFFFLLVFLLSYDFFLVVRSIILVAGVDEGAISEKDITL